MFRIFGRAANPRGIGMGDRDRVAYRGTYSNEQTSAGMWLKVIFASAVVCVFVAMGGMYVSGFTPWKSQTAQSTPMSQANPSPDYADMSPDDLGRLAPAAGGELKKPGKTEPGFLAKPIFSIVNGLKPVPARQDERDRP